MNQPPGPSRATVLLLATSCGIIVGNIYYAQPLLGVIGPAVGLGPGSTSLIMTLSQVGYAAGLLLLVPLGDIVENRRLIVLTIAASVPALLAAALARSGVLFLGAAALLGLTTVSVQMLVPLAAHLAPDEKRGREVGTVMSGMLFGILLARPVASLVTEWLGWRAVFFMSAGVMVVLAVVLSFVLPRRQPVDGPHYLPMLTSLLALPFTSPVLRHRALYQSASFAGFVTFWNAVPWLLMREFHYRQSGIAVFALIAAAGALVAPVAGRLADREHGRAGTVVALLVIAAAFPLALAAAAAHSVVALALAGIVLDMGVQSNLIFGQRAIYALAPAMRSRLNGVFIAIFFAAAALASAFTSLIFTRDGFGGICLLGSSLALLGLLYFWLFDRD